MSYRTLAPAGLKWVGSGCKPYHSSPSRCRFAPPAGGGRGKEGCGENSISLVRNLVRVRVRVVVVWLWLRLGFEFEFGVGLGPGLGLELGLGLGSRLGPGSRVGLG